MLKEKDLDIVLIGTPDHWHALELIAAVEAGADVYCQKPISVDIAEGQAMLAAARKHKRVVQIGTQRRSTPHLMEAKSRSSKGHAGQDRDGRDLLLLPDARDGQSAGHGTAGILDYEMWTGPAPDAALQLAGASAKLARVHGIRQRNRRRHVRPHARHDALDDGPGLAENRVTPPAASTSTKQSKANISDTQTRDVRIPRSAGHLAASHVGRNARRVCLSARKEPTSRRWPIRRYPWGATFYGDKGTLEASVMGYTFTPHGKGDTIHKDVVYELEQYPEDKTEKDLEKHVAPAIRGHMRTSW